LDNSKAIKNDIAKLTDVAKRQLKTIELKIQAQEDIVSIVTFYII